MKQTITVKDLWVDAIIGIYEQEKQNPQPLGFEFSVVIDAKKAIKSDHIDDTIDYYSLTQKVKDYVIDHPYELIETLLDALLQQIASDKRVLEVEMCITKPDALKDFDAIVSLSGSWKR